MGRSYRKKTAALAPLDADDEPLDVQALIEETKARVRPKGLTVAETGMLGQSTAQQRDVPVAAAATGEAADFEGAFTGETAQVTGEGDPNLAAFIAARMAKIRPAETAMAVLPGERREAELYATPAHLQTRKPEAEESSDRWLTGIAEVPLPVDARIRNIAETELAKQRILDVDKREERSDPGRGSDPHSLRLPSGPFFGGEHASVLQSKATTEKRSLKRPPTDTVATDALAMERFVSRERKRFN